MYREKVHAHIRTYVCMYVHTCTYVCVQMLSDANIQDDCYTSHAEVIWVRTPLALASVCPPRSHSAPPLHSPPSPGGGTDAVLHLIHQDRCSPAQATTVLYGNNLVFNVQHHSCSSLFHASLQTLTNSYVFIPLSERWIPMLILHSVLWKLQKHESLYTSKATFGRAPYTWLQIISLSNLVDVHPSVSHPVPSLFLRQAPWDLLAHWLLPLCHWHRLTRHRAGSGPLFHSTKGHTHAEYSNCLTNVLSW